MPGTAWYFVVVCVCAVILANVILIARCDYKELYVLQVGAVLHVPSSCCYHSSGNPPYFTI